MAAKKKNKEKKQKYVHIIDRTSSSLLEHGDGELYGRRDCSHTEHHITGFSQLDEYPSIPVSFEIKPNKAYYLLYCLYQTGDSFGYDTGNIEFIGLYEDIEIAKQNSKLIKEHYQKYKRGHDFDNMFSVDLLDNDKNVFKTHAPWMGYFERLESIEINTLFESSSEYNISERINYWR